MDNPNTGSQQRTTASELLEGLALSPRPRTRDGVLPGRLIKMDGGGIQQGDGLLQEILSRLTVIEQQFKDLKDLQGQQASRITQLESTSDRDTGQPQQGGVPYSLPPLSATMTGTGSIAGRLSNNNQEPIIRVGSVSVPNLTRLQEEGGNASPNRPSQLAAAKAGGPMRGNYSRYQRPSNAAYSPPPPPPPPPLLLRPISPTQRHLVGGRSRHGSLGTSPYTLPNQLNVAHDRDPAAHATISQQIMSGSSSSRRQLYQSSAFGYSQNPTQQQAMPCTIGGNEMVVGQQYSVAAHVNRPDTSLHQAGSPYPGISYSQQPPYKPQIQYQPQPRTHLDVYGGYRPMVITPDHVIPARNSSNNDKGKAHVNNDTIIQQAADKDDDPTAGPQPTMTWLSGQREYKHKMLALFNLETFYPSEPAMLRAIQEMGDFSQETIHANSSAFLSWARGWLRYNRNAVLRTVLDNNSVVPLEQLAETLQNELQSREDFTTVHYLRRCALLRLTSYKWQKGNILGTKSNSMYREYEKRLNAIEAMLPARQDQEWSAIMGQEAKERREMVLEKHNPSPSLLPQRKNSTVQQQQGPSMSRISLRGNQMSVYPMSLPVPYNNQTSISARPPLQPDYNYYYHHQPDRRDDNESELSVNLSPEPRHQHFHPHHHDI